MLLLSFPLTAQQSLPQLTRIDEGEANIRLGGFVDEVVRERIPVIDGMKVIDPDTLTLHCLLYSLPSGSRYTLLNILSVSKSSSET